MNYGPVDAAFAGAEWMRSRIEAGKESARRDRVDADKLALREAGARAGAGQFDSPEDRLAAIASAQAEAALDAGDIEGFQKHFNASASMREALNQRDLHAAAAGEAQGNLAGYLKPLNRLRDGAEYLDITPTDAGVRLRARVNGQEQIKDLAMDEWQSIKQTLADGRRTRMIELQTALSRRQGAEPAARAAGGGAATPAAVAGTMGLTLPQYRAAEQYLRTGKAPMMPNPITNDDEGNPIPPGMLADVTDTGKLAQMQADARKVANAQVASQIDPEKYDGYQRGATELAIREGVYGPGGSVVDGARRAAAVKGRGTFGGNSDVTRDEVTGQTAMTPIGVASEQAGRALATQRIAEANKDDRTDPNLRSGGSGPGGPRANTPEYRAQERLFQAAEKDLADAERALEAAERARTQAVGAALGEKGRTAAEASAQPAITRAEKAIADARTRQAQAQAAMEKIANGGQAPASSVRARINALPPGARQIGTSGGKPVYQTPDGKKFIAE